MKLKISFYQIFLNIYGTKYESLKISLCETFLYEYLIEFKENKIMTI
jgi:hypothetical protein